MKTVVGRHDNHHVWYSEHLQAWTPNIFAATAYTENEATAMMVKMGLAGVGAFTESRFVAAKRYAEENKA